MFLILFAIVIFFAPTLGGLFPEHPNPFEPVNPAQHTRSNIAPVWYFTPYYAILRAVPDKLTGAALDGSTAVLLFFFLPWPDRPKLRNLIRYRGWLFKLFLGAFNRCLPSDFRVSWTAARSRVVCHRSAHPRRGLYSIAFFLLMPWYTSVDKTKPVPERVTHHA